MRWRRRKSHDEWEPEQEADVPVITSVPHPIDVVNIPPDGYFLLPTTWMQLGYVMQATLQEFGVEYPRESEVVATRFANHLSGLSDRVARRVWV